MLLYKHFLFRLDIIHIYICVLGISEISEMFGKKKKKRAAGRGIMCGCGHILHYIFIEVRFKINLQVIFNSKP